MDKLLTQSNIADIYPLSPMQKGMLFHSVYAPGSAMYVEQLSLRLAARIDPVALEQAWGLLVSWHEVLRTVFRWRKLAEPVQVVLKQRPFQLDVVELDLASGTAEAAVQAFLRRDRHLPLALETGPLVRVSLLRAGGEDCCLVWTFHHILLDGWSLPLLLAELMGAYDDLQAGRTPRRAERRPFREHIAWLQRQDPQAAQAHWAAQLRGLDARTPLPLARRQGVRDFADVGEHALTLEPALCAALSRCARQWRVTPNALFQAAFAILLGRLGGGDDIVYGTTVSGRPPELPGVEQMVGQFTNTLPLRISFDGAQTVQAFVAQVQQQIVAMAQHAWIELPRLREYTRLQGSEALFEILFVFENFPVGDSSAGGGLQVSGVRFAEMTNFPLTVIAAPAGDGFVVRAEVAREAYDDAGIARLMGMYRQLLQALVDAQAGAGPQRVGELPLLDAAQAAALRASQRPQRSDFELHDDLVTRIAQQAARAPLAPAVVCGDVALPYGELLTRVRQLAHQLRGLGVGPEVTVALCLERSTEQIVALLAVLEAGGCYLPIEPGLPAERRAYMLADSGARLGIGLGSSALLLREHGLQTVCMAGDAAAIARQPTHAVPGPRHLQQLAYTIYTSGSTGRPKGSLITQANVLRLFQACDEHFHFGPHEVWTLFHSYAFDFSVWEIFGALLHGGRLVVVPALTARAPDALRALIVQQGVTVLSQTPSAFVRLLDAAQAAQDWAWAAPLRQVVFGGEALDTLALAPWFRQRQGSACALVNMYGITETTVHVTYRRVLEADALQRAEPGVGLPLADLSTCVADAHGQLQPAGVAGEILVGGAGLARGYLGRPGLTAERFVPDPYSGRPGARLYRSGDLGRSNAQGEIEHLGRIDQQVKIRGYRIELGEIASALRQHAAVQDAVVLARPGADGLQRLVAYVQARGASGTDAAALRAHLQASLPDYMLPAAFVTVPGFELTVNGKLDTRALPEPDDAAVLQRAYAAPVGEVEETLARLWAELLGLPRVGRDDNFFELGGHSLQAMTLSERMRKAGLQVDVRTLFEKPSLRELAASVPRTAQAAAVPANRIPAGCTRITPDMLPLVALSQAAIAAITAAVPGGAAQVQDIYPLAPLQQGMCFHHLGSSGGDPYLLGAVIAFDSRAFVDAYLQALQAVLQRHDILRTAIHWEGLEDPVQVVWRSATLPAEELQLDPAAGDIAEQLWARVSPLQHRIDIRQAPLLRVAYSHDAAQGRWVLAMLYHHLAIDHTAMDVLQREVQAHLAGNQHQLPAPLPFRDFVAQTRGGPTQAEHEAYFRRMLGDIDEATTPFGLLDVQAGGMDVREARLDLDPALSRRLRERARLLGVSAASLHHLAWALVLARTSGRSEVVFATVLFGRLQGGTDASRALGMFINTLPVRFSVGDTGVRDAVRQAQQTLSGLLQHEHASLALAQRCSGVAAPAPLFSALLNYRHGDLAPEVPPAQALDAPVRLLRAHERTNYPLMLSVDDGASGFSLSVQVQQTVAPERVCQFMQQALETLVTALEQDPAAPLQALDVLPAAERRLVLPTGTAGSADTSDCVHQLYERRVAANAARPAVVLGAQQLTYAELDMRANALAQRLQAAGAGPDSRVALCAERGLDMVVAVLAILKAGAAYVPLDVAHPPQRLAAMLQDSAPLVVLSAGRGHAAVSGLVPGLAVWRLEEDAAAQADGARPPVVAGLTPEHLAYVIYTSGSTGVPKGIAMPHGPLVNLLQWHAHSASARPHPVALQFASIGFDVAFQEIFSTLTAGGTLVLIDEDSRFDARRLCAVLQRHGVDRLFLPNAALRLLADSFAQGELADGELPQGLREVITAGDQLKVTPAVVQLLRQWPGCVLENHYGPTETHVATACRLEGDPAAWPALPPIGRPIAHASAYVLDALGRPTPLGVAGELFLGGAALARGYLRRPELTQERFIADPYSALPQARMYKTGDLARWLPDGQLEFLGRNDFQIKLRGFRVEPGEIEARLALHPAVREAAVLALGTGGEQRLVCYYTHSGTAAPDALALRAHLAATLPEYMLPAAFVPLAALPLSRNGKLDRKALPAPEAQALAQRAYRAPATEAETVLAGVWQEVLGVPRVGRDDNFFDLGGHSLLAIRLVNRWAALTGLQMPIRAIFEAQSLAQLAAGAAGAQAAPGEIPRLPAADCHPLSHAQRRIWFQVQLQGAEEAYNMPSAVRVRGALDAAALAQSLQRLVQRHAVLRTTFITVDGEPMQWVADDMPVLLAVHQAPGADEAARLQAVREQLADFAVAPFNLETGPLLRGRVYRLADDDHVVALVVHHIVCDGWSLELLVRELCEGAPAADGSPALQYADFAAWQRAKVDAGDFDNQRAHWLAELATPAPPLQLPLDRPRSALHSYTGSRHRITLQAGLHARLAGCAQAHGASPFMLLFATWNLLLSRWCGQQDIVVGVPVAGRQHPQLEGLLGVFVNTLPLRTRLDGVDSFGSLLQRVRRCVLQGLSNQDYPFERLVGELNAERDLSRQALFDTSFAWQAASQATSTAPAASGVKVQGFDFEFARSKFDLGVTVASDAAATQLEIEFNSDLFDRDTVQRLAESFECLLAAAVEDPALPLHALPLQPAARVHALVHQLGGARQRYAPTRDLASHLAEQAARFPTRTALVCGKQRLTYAELDARSNRLARHLQRLGVLPEQPVGLCLPRSVEQVVAIVAVLKAGGCYLPIEPDYPDERLAYMLSDAGAHVAIGLGDTAARLQAQGVHAVCLERDAALIQALPASPLASTARPDNLAYIIYTSGSTGRPKGTLLTHANVLRLFNACGERFEFNEHDVWTLFHSVCFDFSVWEIFGALLHGATLVVVPQDVARSPTELAALLQGQGVTVLSQTPSAFGRLLDSAALAAGWDFSAALRYVVFGGEALDHAALRPWFAHRQGTASRLINMYGITETTVHVTWREVTAADVTGTPARRVGGPLADLALYVLDDQGQPQPVGVGGEIHVGGAGLARGYLHRAALTAQRFVPDPYSAVPGARMYRSGDLARWRADGDLEYLGRADQQVKIRGHRIEPGELESALLAHAAVTGAAAVVSRDRAQRDCLLMYYTGPESVSTTALRAFLARTLPEYMLPLGFVHLREFPLTGNGKLDRSRLPYLQAERPQLDAAYLAPRNALEAQIAAIWQEVLLVDQVGVHDNFFDLGGESFSAYRVMARIAADLGHELPVSAIFQAQTVASMAESVHAAIDASDERMLVPLQPGSPGRRPFFCVHPAGGDVLGFQDLARAFGPEQPFYGLQSSGRFLDAQAHASIEEMAAAYVREMRSLQPEGPYLLGGHSMGALVAFEMARQLDAAGERIGVLALMDGEARSAAGLLDTLLLVVDTFELPITRAELTAVPETEMMGYVMRKSKKRFARVLEIAYDMDILPRGFRTRDAEQFMARIGNNIDLATRYQLQPLQQPAVLFTAAEASENTAAVDVELWRRYVPAGLTVIAVPGNHLTLVKRPHASTLAAELSALFQRVDAEHGAYIPQPSTEAAL